MKYVGIDMSKDSFHACFSEKNVVEFQNSKEGIVEFINFLEESKHLKTKTKLGVESTGVYHLPLIASLSRSNWSISVINPIISSRAIQNDSLRRVKTDKKDARIIRELTEQGKGYVYQDTDEVRKLQALCSERTALVRMRAQCKQRLHTPYQYGQKRLTEAFQSRTAT